MEGLLSRQIDIYNEIERMQTNFHKDSASRKTEKYIQARMEKLEELWKEFEDNDHKLESYEDKDSLYFNNNFHAKTKEAYLFFKTTLSVFRDKILGSIASGSDYDPEQGTSKQEEQESEYTLENETVTSRRDQGIKSKTEELLKKQSSNFRAFKRTVDSMDIPSASERWELEDMLHNLQLRWSVIDKMHWEIDSELEGSNARYETMFSNYEKVYIDIKKRINSQMWAATHREKTTPKIEIPEFNGSYRQWVPFKDLFLETIHNNSTLSGAQKMQFLKSKVRGEAERLIQHLPISAENYKASWDILNNRYNNKKMLFNSYINIMLNIPTMQHPTVGHMKRLHDTCTESLNAIKNLGVNIDTWDPLLVHLLSQKLDSSTFNDYMESLREPRELPTIQDFLNFLESKFTTMESARRKQDSVPQRTYQNQPRDYPTRDYTYQNQPRDYPARDYQHTKPNSFYNKQNQNKQSYYSSKVVTNNSTKHVIKCPICISNEHGIYFCKQFLEMSPLGRKNAIAKRNLCYNCLYDHNGNACKSTKRCRNCNGYHNSILHDAFSYDNPTPSTSREPRENHTETTKKVNFNSHISQDTLGHTETLLATAMIKIRDAYGSYHLMRALIDQGSQLSLITEKAAQQLSLSRQRCRGIISGVGTKESICKGRTNLHISSRDESYQFDTNVYIMKDLIKNLPNTSFIPPLWPGLENINLADPDFNKSRSVEILLGADIYANIVMEGIRKSSEESALVAQQTRLGWILCGNLNKFHCNVVLNTLEDIERFWHIEDIFVDENLSEEDYQCIKYYQETLVRNQDGRYQVRLPLKPGYEELLGDSKPRATAQYLQLERKLNKQTDIASEYKEFINEYRMLGHMIPVPATSKTMLTESNKTPQCFLPHHCVVRTDATTTKLRVVFNASSPTSTGKSLNDVMARGPNLQKDLQTLILKWRQYKIGFTADIEKMFRQIWINEHDQKLQTILWRDSSRDMLREYQLTTVTYGTKAAPFLAMMTLHQLARDERCNYQDNNAPKVLEEAFYMDDLLHGAHTIKDAVNLKENLINLLQRGGFNLRKWRSNCAALEQGNIKQEQALNNYEFQHAETTKTLGLKWNPQQDVFCFESKINETSVRTTKRMLLSEISKIFDPLGWLTPITTKLKLLFQLVWRTETEWDQNLPSFILEEWIKIRTDIKNIHNIKVPRWLGTEIGPEVELHGFSDASSQAYACVIYCRVNKNNTALPTLLAAKARIVSNKKSITIPRLELCGAELLSRLMEKIQLSLNEYNIKVYAWTDSTAVLGWLNGDPNKWKPFVAHRVSKITAIIPPSSWRYVSSENNPADCASRGITATQLLKCDTWWQGPTYLSSFNKDNEKQITFTTEEEKRTSKQDSKKFKKSSIKQVNIVQQESQENVIEQLLSRYSCFNKLVRVLGWVRRFCTKKQERYQEPYLTLKEIKISKEIIIKYTQQDEFSEEINYIQENKQVSSKSKIINLNPYIDENGILRVGGRLRNAYISPEMKNPIIIPYNHRITELIIKNAHELTYHGGARITLATTRQKYWVISGNRAVKKYIRKCVICKKQKPIMQRQLRGDLPGARVNPSRPFKHVGVDFTGHIYLKANKGRGIKTTKGYVAVFVCMATKAVHLELVSDLTTSAFIAALRRMAARRGTPSDIYCDNGRNFVGSSRVIQEEYQEILQSFSHDLQKDLADMEIKFHFNSPSWPSAGGLWEAAVKSFKFHLKRVIGEQKLTYEEFSTLLSQIEACLNSRPLCALTEDPQDLNYLTPSHFLTSGPILTLVETEKDLRTRWHLTEKILHDVWKRWQAEYLSQLTTRSKWRYPKENLKVDDVVLVHEDNLPPGKWVMGRVMELHPGKDGYVRVVTIKTKGGYLKRPVIKLSKLIENENEHSSSPDQPRKIKPKKSILATVLTAFLIFMTIISSSEANVNITKFRENQSLYFDKVANMLLIKDEWKLVVYYEMAPYWQGNKALDSYIQTLDKACDTMKTQAHCDAVLLQLRHSYKELEYYNQLLLSQQLGEQPDRRRVRRGLINGVGYLANSLFGVLDERFAEQYKKDISLLQENQKHIVQLWKNQTSIAESENNLLKRTESAMNQQHKIINKHMITIETAIQELKNTAQTNSAINDFAIGSIIASNVLNNLRNIQNTLIDTVTDIYQGRFNLHLLTPEQLIDELSIISSKIPKDVSLPVDNIHSDLRTFYNLVKVKARMLPEYLLFEIRIPLINRETYEIFKIMSIPKYSGKEIIKLSPVSEYVATNFKKSSFIPMSEIDVKGCFTQKDTYFCHSQKPEYQMKSDKNLCEMENQECITQTSVCKNSWQESYVINTYIYMCCEQCHVRTICDTHMSAHQLTGAGLITIGHGCVIKTDEFTIYPHKPHTSEVHMTPDLYAPTIAPINHVINLTIPQLNLTNPSHLEFEQESSAIKKRIEEMKDIQVLSEGVSNHDVHHYAMIYFILCIVVGTALFIIIKRLKSKCSREQSSARVEKVDRIEAVELEHRPAPAAAPRPANPRRGRNQVEMEAVPPTTSTTRNKSTSPILRKFNEIFKD